MVIFNELVSKQSLINLGPTVDIRSLNNGVRSIHFPQHHILYDTIAYIYTYLFSAC